MAENARGALARVRIVSGLLDQAGGDDGPITNRIAWLRQQRRENLP
jgi:hypothetical protein